MEVRRFHCVIYFLSLKFFSLGARSFYVIDTDKKQLIEVEANSKDDLEKYKYFMYFNILYNCLCYRWLEWIEKARKPFEKSKSNLSSNEKSINPLLSSQPTPSFAGPKPTTRYVKRKYSLFS